jgi:hypothetical protein
MKAEGDLAVLTTLFELLTTDANIARDLMDSHLHDKYLHLLVHWRSNRPHVIHKMSIFEDSTAETS